jgi:muconate cycloisomerase
MTAPHLIERIEVRILDIPTIRPHKLSFGSISRQSPVIVQHLAGGACGFGEAATIGGPSWNEESPESILHAITTVPGARAARPGRLPL